MRIELLYLSFLRVYIAILSFREFCISSLNFLLGQLQEKGQGCLQGNDGGRVGEGGVPVDTFILGGNNGNIW